ncbi:Rhodopirellula transposase DDE domain protein [uncultured archaeon]|nr:Rhodopirellula transposase DDE domain protein [uncultured archaeon]
MFGWFRETVELGLNELRTGIECLGNFSARGRDKSEEIVPQLEEDIRSLVEPESQIDPKFQTSFKYTRITARDLRKALIDKKGWKNEDLPTENTLGNILNRLGYRLRRVQKRKPIKRVKETDQIFDSVHEVNEVSAAT